jgi:hypothetical protein
VLGMDCIATHDITVSSKQRLLAFPNAHGTSCLAAYQDAETHPVCNNSFIECCSMTSVTKR